MLAGACVKRTDLIVVWGKNNISWIKKTWFPYLKLCDFTQNKAIMNKIRSSKQNQAEKGWD